MKRLTNTFISLLYECSLYTLSLIAFPKMLYQLIFHKKYRTSFLARMGIGYPKIDNKNHSLTWIHAVSVGETKAVVSLAREIKRQYPEMHLVVSSTTETGHAEAKRSLPFADQHVFIPFDFRFLTHRIMAQAAPNVVILCESDFWYNFLKSARDNGASIALVNGKMSEKSMQRFHFVNFFSSKLFELFDVLCLQNQFYRKRFVEATAPEDRLVVTGNLKLDEDYPHLSSDEIKQWRQKLGIESSQLVLTIGSTHNPEEQMFIQVLKEIWKKHPSLKVILVPRHPERFKEVAALLEKEHVSAVNFTDIQRCTGKEQVILVDAMGMLRMCYQLSDIALVGGSYTSKVGGHNILEPCWYGKPVLFGPCMHTQVELVSIISQYEAGFQVDIKELKQYLERWLDDPIERTQVGQKGLKMLQDVKGSTKRTLDALAPILSRLENKNAKNEKF